MVKNKDFGNHILIVDDNDTLREGMVRILQKEGYSVSDAPGGIKGLGIIGNRKVDLVITDYKMADMNGLEFLEKIKAANPEIEVIVITAYGTIELAVETMKQGAWDFITKPFSKDELLLKVERISQVLQERSRISKLAEENQYLREEMDIRFNFGEIIGESAGMKKIYKTIEKVAKRDTSILILGESGTGKELVARAIHYHSLRMDKPFIRLNCGALAEGVLESELFGHEKGAFTHALRRKKGRFELADKGTLFLDEIGDIPLNTQIKLLRILQEKEFERVGGEETLRVDVRVITATHRNLMEEVGSGNFREDLYYRLNILPVHVPPLRERKEDIPLLVNHFLKQLETELGKTDLRISREALDLLSMYDWPGNVRELENILERAVVLSEESEINIENLSFLVSDGKDHQNSENPLNLDKALFSLEKQLLTEAMKAARGVKVRAARLLGIKESTLYYKLAKFGLSDPD